MKMNVNNLFQKMSIKSTFGWTQRTQCVNVSMLESILSQINIPPKNPLLDCLGCILFPQESSVRGDGVPEGAAAPLAADRETLQLPRCEQLGPAKPDGHTVLGPQLGGHAPCVRAPLPYRRGGGRPG